MTEEDLRSPEERARKRVDDFTGLMLHIAVFVIVNAFLWGIDIAGGDGVNWAYWVTISWGIGLAFHVAAYNLDESGLQNRRYQRYLVEEQERDSKDKTATQMVLGRDSAL